MNVTEDGKWQLSRGQYLGEISALCFLQLPPHLSSSPFLLAGTGSQILVCDLVRGEVSSSFQVFQGIRVHGISLEYGYQESAGSVFTFRIAVFGEKKVKLFSLQIQWDSLQQQFLNMKLTLIHSLPNFSNWVLDVCFLKDNAASRKDACYLGVGCADNSLHFWDILKVNMFSEVKCSERCLLYSMRMVGSEIDSLLVASGTIFNEIIVWKVVVNNNVSIPESHAEDHDQIIENFMLLGLKYESFIITRLIGHEGSIFRIAWLSNCSKLLSVSDDRSARIWEIQAVKVSSTSNIALNMDNKLKGPVLFGHNARIWDCCIFDTLIITAGEDCTSRVWDHTGRELKIIKEHTGRGVWRCLYDPNSSVLVTAGFDSAIRVHHLCKFNEGSKGTISLENSISRKEVIALSIPNSSGHGVLMDSKSEYVRCLHLSREDSLYVATNNGYLYHAYVFTNGTVKWTKLIRVSTEAPIICMDILSNCSNFAGVFEDWVAVGDGKGSMTVIVIVGSGWNLKVELTFTWSAEKKRHLLGTFWCRSSKNRFIFTTDPGGSVKLWSLYQIMPSPSISDRRSYDVYLMTEFISCFRKRIMCIDASFDKEVLVCGDIRGNLVLFSLPMELLNGNSLAEVKISPTNNFKGVHGISSIYSVSVAGLCFDQVEIRSTGADGCICFLQHNVSLRTLKFMGMKQVKDLSAIRAVLSIPGRFDDSSCSNYAVGFASANFMIWNLTSDTEVLLVTCGGWRRPHSYYLGNVPEMQNCYSFVKDDIIFIHRHWVPESFWKMNPQNLHIQFHGREIHSLCFISGNSLCDKNRDLESSSCWIATGCEDGTVRLTWYDPSTKAWSISKHLGEHVGGSAVRSISCVSKSYMFLPDSIDMPNWICGETATLDNQENPVILISVGAKRVMTVWKQSKRMSRTSNDTECSKPDSRLDINTTSWFGSQKSALSFHWLFTDMPSKHTTYRRKQNAKKVQETAENINSSTSNTISNRGLHSEYQKLGIHCEDNLNDWRYMDVTAFIVKDVRSRKSVIFVVVSCSDATLTLRALVMPFQHWFDIAFLSPLSAPVLALQHVIIPKLLPSKGNIDFGSLYLVICGSTDGSITFWDLTKCVENFMQQISGLQIENFVDFQKRPYTGRGSQGGRQRHSEYNHYVNEISGDDMSFGPNGPGLVSVGPMKPESEMPNLVPVALEIPISEQTDSPVSSHIGEQASISLDERNIESIPEPTVVASAHVLSNVHQSGVNCLHISDINYPKLGDSRFSFCVITGGDDQAINCLRCDLEIKSPGQSSDDRAASINCGTPPVSYSKSDHSCQIQSYELKLLHLDKIASAHSSAVKGVWMDENWVFSTGVDQRVRCWKFDHDRLTEYAHLIISVPEPEAMDVKVFGRNCYQIIVAGRGMQIMAFCFETGR